MEYADKPELEVIEAARAGDELAMEYLLKHYQGLMSYICDKYYLKDGERDDLMQEAMIGFVQSVKSYKPENGKQFKNFAYLCIKRELDSCVKRSNRKKHMVLNDAGRLNTMVNTLRAMPVRLLSIMPIPTIPPSNMVQGTKNSSMAKAAMIAPIARRKKSNANLNFSLIKITSIRYQVCMCY